MKKVYLAQIIFLLVMAVGVFLLGLEIFAGHMDPDRIIIFAVVAGAGLLGTCICALWRAFARWDKK